MIFMNRLRVAIVGAGIVGASIARILSSYQNVDILLIDKEPDVGWGSSKANTSIIHPCHEEDPRVHPLRAELCLRGNKLWREWVEELEIPAKWPGELMIFTDSDEEKRAREFLEIAKMNKVPGVRVVDREELKILEPNVSNEVLGALYAPTAGIISPFEAVIAIVENAVDNGVKLLTETYVEKVRVSSGRVLGVETSRGFIEADIVINASGIYADKISHTAGVELDFKILPRRGEYVLFDEDVDVKPTKILHTTPTPRTKGVYAITTVHGNMMIGPTAEDLPIDAKEDLSTTVEGVEYVLREARKLLRSIPPKSRIIRMFTGLRPEPPGGQWLIKVYEDPWGFVNVAGIRSPGLTAAPAIAEYVVKLIEDTYDIKLAKKNSWSRFRRDMVRVGNRSLEEVDKLIEKNPDYGEIVCICKTVSKAEVLEAVERILKIGAKVTLDGIKFRTYAGFGKCQGSFCRWRIALLISEKLGIPLNEVVVKKSSYGIGDVKMLWREAI